MFMRRSHDFTFTGWHMAGVVCLFFGTIISVNVYMAYQAVHSWSGLVVENTYVASQQFNGKVEEAKRLAASGLSGTLTVGDGMIRYRMVDAAGRPVVADELTVRFKRPVGDHQDFELLLSPLGNGVYEAQREVLPGHWIVEVTGLKSGERILHHSKRIAVRGPAS
ncbi:FixH family protein [Rhizobium sp. SAFR-030]|uniref:FixH family protein n=1 Tax=Rhizobium sp. SAFR-030 TaxID=3387277 RepID=UPI003F7EEC47